MNQRADSWASGHYARHQLLCKDAVIRWSHRTRFMTACRLVEAAQRRETLLDYGFGDGTFLEMVRGKFGHVAGAGIDPTELELARKRFAGVDNLSFHDVYALGGTEHTGRYDVVACMEVLEHCPDREVDEALANIDRLVAPDGLVLISVPVEIGPSLVVKQALRRVAGWRKLGDYRHNERYTLRELARMTVATSSAYIERPVYDLPTPTGRVLHFHPHKGFNWKTLQRKIEATFRIEAVRFSPTSVLGGLAASQVFFVCRPRASARPENG